MYMCFLIRTGTREPREPESALLVLLAARGSPPAPWLPPDARTPQPQPAQYVSVSLATCVGLCRFGEAWAALGAEKNLRLPNPRAQPSADRVVCPVQPYGPHALQTIA